MTRILLNSECAYLLKPKKKFLFKISIILARDWKVIL